MLRRIWSQIYTYRSIRESVPSAFHWPISPSSQPPVAALTPDKMKLPASCARIGTLFFFIYMALLKMAFAIGLPELTLATMPFRMVSRSCFEEDFEGGCLVYLKIIISIVKKHEKKKKTLKTQDTPVSSRCTQSLRLAPCLCQCHR